MSRSAVPISGMLHPVHVMMMVSMLRSASGMRSADPSSRWTGMGMRRAVVCARASSRGDGSSPEDLLDPPRIERKIEAGADADVENAAFGCACDPLAIRTQPLAAHRQVDERRQYPVLVEAHHRAPSWPAHAGFRRNAAGRRGRGLIVGAPPAASNARRRGGGAGNGS